MSSHQAREGYFNFEENENNGEINPKKETKVTLLESFLNTSDYLENLLTLCVLM